MTKPKVSICCCTYNHENFIRETLDGFFMQKTNFPFEIIIHDDVSTDNTVSIIKEYEKKYPGIIKPIYQTEKQYGFVPFLDKYVYPAITGEYVAICEGDDYWTHPDKLQKQVDFLDANPDFSVCFHPVKVIFEDKSSPDTMYPSPELRFNTNVLSIYHLLQRNFIQTNSVMYRWRFSEANRSYMYGTCGVMPHDWYMHLLHAQVGKIGFLDEMMAVYRRHSAGIWQADLDTIHSNFGTGELRFFLHLEKYFPEYNQLLGHKYTCFNALHIFNAYLKHQDFQSMQEIMTMCPDFLEVTSNQSPAPTK